MSRIAGHTGRALVDGRPSPVAARIAPRAFPPRTRVRSSGVMDGPHGPTATNLKELNARVHHGQCSAARDFLVIIPQFPWHSQDRLPPITAKQFFGRKGRAPSRSTIPVHYLLAEVKAFSTGKIRLVLPARRMLHRRKSVKRPESA